MAENIMDRELGWVDSLEHDSELTLRPAVDDWFTVLGFERSRYTPGSNAKLPPCNMAVLKLAVTNGELTAIVTDRLYLHSKCEGMLCAFFSGIGQRKHGEPLKMNWNAVIGSRGRCKVSVREWTHQSTGEKMQSNEVKDYYEYDPTKMTMPSVAPTASYQPGQF